MTDIDLTRTVEIADLDVSRADGDHREIVAYAAVFDTPTEITDHDGHYWETISRTAFDRTIAQRGDKVRVMFNHGRDVFGQSSDRFALPIGKPIEMRPDGRGLYTRTKISRTELGDEVLELARDGVITGFSFRARALGTRDHGVLAGDGLPTFERTEFALREYGPGVFVAYEDAEILQVRTRHWLDNLTDAERSELRKILADTPDGSSHGQPDPADPGPSETPNDQWRTNAVKALLRFDLKDIRP